MGDNLLLPWQVDATNQKYQQVENSSLVPLWSNSKVTGALGPYSLVFCPIQYIEGGSTSQLLLQSIKK